MKKSSLYHIFLFLSTFTRGLVEVFSLVLLYQKGFSIHEIFFFLFLMYSIGIFVNYFSLTFYYKIVLVLSSFFYGISFLYLSSMNTTFFSLILLAILLSWSNYSYHAIRHLLAFLMLEDQGKSTNRIVNMTYLGMIISSITGIYLMEKLSFTITSIIIFLLSFLAIFPILKLKKIPNQTKKTTLSSVKIENYKIVFSILEQFKVIFLELQPLFLYIYIKSSISYVGTFNIIVNLASLIVVYFLVRRMKLKYFKYISVLLGITFLFKLNLKNSFLLLLLAFLEGILVKLYENVSLKNLYTTRKNTSIREYLILEEFIFFGSKSIIMLFFYLSKLSLIIMMYLCIVGIITSGFFIKENQLIQDKTK